MPGRRAGAYVTKDGDIQKIVTALGEACRHGSTHRQPVPEAVADPMPALRHGKPATAGAPAAGPLEDAGAPADPPARRSGQQRAVLAVSLAAFVVMAALLRLTFQSVEAGALAVLLAVPVAALAACVGPVAGVLMATAASAVLLGDHLGPTGRCGPATLRCWWPSPTGWRSASAPTGIAPGGSSPCTRRR